MWSNRAVLQGIYGSTATKRARLKRDAARGGFRMKRLLLPLLAVAALAVPAAASAHFGLGGFAKLSGTGSTFAATSATASGTAISGELGTGTFSLSLSTNLSAATTHTGE